MLEAALTSFANLGLIVVDKEGNRLWQYNTSKGQRLYGLGIDPTSGNIYYGMTNKIVEVTRLGNKVWEFSDPQRFQGVHAIDVIGPGRILVTSDWLSRVLEVDKKLGVVQEWKMEDYFQKPSELPDRDWLHLNWVKREENGDLLISTLYKPPKGEKDKSEVLRIKSSGELAWRWSEVSERPLKSSHALAPFRDHYLISETFAQRIIEVDESGVVYKTLDVGRPLYEIEVIDQDRILTACAPSEQHPSPAIIWINWDDGEKTIYEPHESGLGGGHSVKYVPNWSADPTPEEQEVITERLRKLGYLE